MKKNFFLALFVLTFFTSWAQSEKRHSVGVNFITVPFDTKYLFAEYEFFISEHAALSARLGYFEYKDDSESYLETGSGLGWGVTFRWYFGSKPMEGFLVGAGFEFFNYDWESEDGSFGNALEISPHAQVGYRFNFGKLVYLTPSVVAGPTFSLSTDLDNEASVYIIPALVIGLRF